MKKRISIFVFLVFVVATFSAQKTEEVLIAKTWYSAGLFGADEITLSAENTNTSLHEIKFSITGKLLLKQVKKRTIDTASTYLLNKNTLSIHLNYKDSAKIFEYALKKVTKNKVYQLSLISGSRYIKRKGDDTIAVSKLVLTQGKKTKIIKNMQSITVISQKKALRNDSIDFAIWGQFVGYIADTLIMDCDQYIEHNFYKKYTDSLHYISPVLYDTVIRIKVPIKEVTRIYTQREPFVFYANGVTIAALGAGLACIGGSLIWHDQAIGSNLGAIGVGALLTIPISFGLSLIFSSQKFYLKPGEKQVETWKVERRMPHTILVKRNQKRKTLK